MGVHERVKTVVVTKIVDDAELDELLTPRASPMVERANGSVDFDLEDGPFTHYHRHLDIGDADPADGRHTVVETTEFQLAIPVWGFLFRPLVVHAIKKPPAADKRLWWLPPDNMDSRATQVLSLLCVFSALAGYLGVLLSQTNTYFKDEFGATNTEIADTQIAVRVGAFLALFIVAYADRRGRRTILVASAYIGIILAATGAFAPSLMLLGVSQGFARAFSAAIGLLVSIIAIEEMPAGARAFAVSLLAMSAALGAGGVVCFLWAADKTEWAWRGFFLVPLLFVPLVLWLSHRLPETRRFEVHELNEERKREHRPEIEPGEPVVHTEEPIHGGPLAKEFEGDHRSQRMRRFIMLGATAFFFNIFLAPAGNFLNEFLRTEHGYSGGTISVLQVLTNVPGGIAIIVGGRLADQRGRRLIGSIGIIGGVGFTVLMFLGSGWEIWVFSALATLVGAMTIPALGVYQSELFPTGSRGLANGGLALLGVFGAVVGLKAAGQLADHYGSFGPAMAILAIGPAIVAVIVILFYPETTHRELEDLNPEDAPPPHDPEAVAALDQEWSATHEGPSGPRSGADDNDGDPTGTLADRA